MQRNTKKKIAPVVVTLLVILYILPPVMTLILASIGLFASEMRGMIVFLVFYGLIGGAVIVGIIKALSQRLREIDGGEEDEASQY